MECVRCQPGYAPIAIVEQFEKNLCLALVQVENCIRYDTSPLIVGSSFKCVECSPEYYVRENRCILR